MEAMFLLHLVLASLKSMQVFFIGFLKCRHINTSHSEQCDSTSKERAIYDSDIRVVAKELGMIGWRDDKCEDYNVEEAVRLLDEKAASVWELEEAFYIFDRNEDGFITAAELWNVLRRLGFQEGVRLEDCERMIMAFDEDRDGRISLSEFKTMLENAS